ncbi:MAG: hypothetical protein IJB79_00030 [Candidatus Gastranaerophilales bacterium]|nr:hypothetical protein [Candidatus Gastranaerophilales bacterium]
MRIQALTSFKNISRINNNKTNSILTKPQYDSFSFSGKVLSYEEMKPLKLQAYQIQQDSIQYQNEALEIKDDAYFTLSKAKEEYIQALKYCNSFKKNPSKLNLTLPNGNVLEYKFELKNGNFTLEIEEKNDEDAIVKTISAVNFAPVKVANYNQDGVDLFEYSGNNVVAIKNLSADGASLGQYDSIYSYRSGKLYSALFGGNLATFLEPSEKMIVYFDDKPTIYSLGNIVNPKGNRCSADERYVFIGNSLSNYYYHFCGSDQGEMLWDESFHFEKGKFIGSINNGEQKAKNEDIISNDAVYLNDDNQFVRTTKLHARVSDFGLPVFVDCEN